jgi:signal transduction histidine kinase/DNA-binding response OmpR family regulator
MSVDPIASLPRESAGPEKSALVRVFPGPSELAKCMRDLDWSATDIGPPQHWPQTWRAATTLCLTSRIPVVMYLGQQYTVLYNDAYISFLGPTKHSRMLGAPGHECWKEIWPTIGPMLAGVYATATATWSEDVQMFFARDLPLEEVFVRFSFGPIIREDGLTVDGVFCPCTETTQQVVSARRLETLRQLGVLTECKTVGRACRDAAEVLAGNPRDISCAAIYLRDSAAGDQARLYASCGVESAPELFPDSVSLIEGAQAVWPLGQAMRSHSWIAVGDLVERGVRLPGGPYPEPSTAAVVVPFEVGTADGPRGAIVFGASPRIVLDDTYRTFFSLVASHVAKVVGDAHAFETEQRRIEELAALDRAKVAFFSNVSHEFRTPLTLMLGPISDLLSDATVPPGILASLSMVRRNTLRLQRLVNTLLDFSRAEAGRLRADFGPVNLAVLTQDLASSFRSTIEHAGVRFEVHCQPVENVYVDAQMWEKIVLNLISNAFKNTLQGEIAVRLFQEGSSAVLDVTDTGIGISKQDIPHLFQRFFRVAGAGGRSHEGSGIGLALVHDFVRMHGGEVAVKSELGKGSTFQVRLPVGSHHLPAEHIRARTADTSMSTAHEAYLLEAKGWLTGVDDAAHDERLAADAVDLATSARIVLADDNADMRDYLRVLLARNYHVECVSDGQQALDAARRERPDLIITDVMMPNLDGFGLLRAMRSDAQLRHVPIIMLSARAGEEARAESFDAGVDDYLTKPFSPRELVSRVGSTIRLTRMRQKLEGQLQEDLKAMQLLCEIGNRCIRSCDDLDPPLIEIVDAAIALAKANKGNIQLRDTRAAGLYIAAQRGFEQRFLDFFAEVRSGDRAACGQALAAQERVVVEDVSSSALFDESARAELLAAGVCSVISTPLISGAGAAIGMLSTHFSQCHRPDERTLHLLDLLARQVADYLERKQREGLLTQAQRGLKEADRQKNEFLAMLAHELRNPLAPIKYVVELLSQQAGDIPAVRSTNDVLRRQVTHLARLVDDLMDVSRITLGRIELKREPVQIADMVGQSVESVLPLIRQKQHKLEITSHATVRVSADPARLVQCLVNILTNSVKYTPSGGEIRIVTAEEAGYAVISITDNGPGLDADLLPHVFDLFVQGVRTLDRSQGGLGIGLAVVRRLVEMHEGQVAAFAAASGQGLTVEVRLPLLKEAVEPLAFVSTVVTPSLRILIVDDSKDAAECLGTLLSLDGHEILATVSSKEAVESALSFKPDVALLDIGLPEVDGFELARRFTAAPGLQDVCLIALTGYGHPEDKARAKEAGFDHYLVKPVELSTLRRTLASGANGHA